MKIFVTGGAGYIGSVTVEKLLEAGFDVVVFDNLSQGHRAAVSPQASFVLGDLADKAAVSQALAEHQPDAVMHFAAYSLVGESEKNPLKYLGANVTNAAHLFEGMLENGIHKFILSSTANLFDQPERIPITETEHINPGSPYGESKAMIERMLFWLDKKKEFRSVALRYFNAAGATEAHGEDHTPETHLIPIVLQTALGQREKVVIFGDQYPTPDGTCIRDYIHIADLAQAHILAVRSLLDGGSSRKYNLGNGRGYSVREVIETARRVTGCSIPAVLGETRTGDPATLIAGSETIRRELGWNPQYSSLEAILESAWNWHKNHPHGYGSSAGADTLG